MRLVAAAIEEQSSSEYCLKEEQMRRHAEESRPDGPPEPNVRRAMVLDKGCVDFLIYDGMWIMI